MLDRKKKYVIVEPMKIPSTSLIEPCYPYSAYCALVCEIPCGMIATDVDILRCLGRVYGIEGLRVERVRTKQTEIRDEIYPNWRVVSERGHLLNCNDKETQKKLLEEEGLEVYEPNPDVDSYVVRNYANKKFDFSTLNISIRPDYGAYESAMKESLNIRNRED